MCSDVITQRSTVSTVTQYVKTAQGTLGHGTWRRGTSNVKHAAQYVKTVQETLGHGTWRHAVGTKDTDRLRSSNVKHTAQYSIYCHTVREGSTRNTGSRYVKTWRQELCCWLCQRPMPTQLLTATFSSRWPRDPREIWPRSLRYAYSVMLVFKYHIHLITITMIVSRGTFLIKHLNKLIAVLARIHQDVF